MEVLGMNKIMEDFLSNKWNLYGLQMACGSLMVMVLHNYLTFVGMCAMGLCVYLIAICQRILGVRYGMIFYESRQDELDKLVKMIKKGNKKKEKKDE